MSLREKYILICGNKRPEEDPRGSCGLKCPNLRALFKDELGKRKIHKRFRALTSSCLDECGTGPTVCVMPDNVWYAGVGPGDVGEIIESHLLGGKPVRRLLAGHPGASTPSLTLPLEGEGVEVKIRRRLLVLSAAGTFFAMAATLLGFIFLLRVEYSLAAGDLSLETHRYLRLRVLGEFPWAFRVVWTLRLLAVVLAGLYLAAWSRTLREEKPFFTQAALYFLGLGVTLEGLAWTQAVHGLPSLAAWFEETVTADQAIPFRLFGILQGEQNLLSNGLALGFLCLAGSLLSAASRSSKSFPKQLGVFGLALSASGLALAIAWHSLAIHAAWAISILLALGGLTYMGYAVLVWFQYAEEDEE